MGIIRKEDVHSSFNDYIKEVVDYDSTITSLNENTQNISNLQTNKADKTELFAYEEGNWTPSITGQTVLGAYTYANQFGYYIKVNKIVHVWFDVAISNVNTAGEGATQIIGLPFVIDNINALRSGGHVSSADYINMGDGFTQYLLDGQSSANKIYLFKTGSGKNANPIAIGNVTTNSRIKGYYIYKTL